MADWIGRRDGIPDHFRELVVIAAIVSARNTCRLRFAANHSGWNPLVDGAAAVPASVGLIAV